MRDLWHNRLSSVRKPTLCNRLDLSQTKKNNDSVWLKTGNDPHTNLSLNYTSWNTPGRRGHRDDRLSPLPRCCDIWCQSDCWTKVRGHFCLHPTPTNPEPGWCWREFGIVFVALLPGWNTSQYKSGTKPNGFVQMWPEGWESVQRLWSGVYSLYSCE